MYFFRRYRVLEQKCSRDGLNVGWVIPDGMDLEEAPKAILAGLTYMSAIAADLHTLRNGLYVIFDSESSGKHGVSLSIGKRMLKSIPLMPIRPQALFMVEPSTLKRVVLRTMIGLIKMIVSSKIMGRIELTKIEGVLETVPEDKFPIRTEPQVEAVAAFVKDRLDNFPLPPGWPRQDVLLGQDSFKVRHACI